MKKLHLTIRQAIVFAIGKVLLLSGIVVSLSGCKKYGSPEFYPEPNYWADQAPEPTLHDSKPGETPQATEEFVTQKSVL